MQKTQEVISFFHGHYCCFSPILFLISTILSFVDGASGVHFACF